MRSNSITFNQNDIIKPNGRIVVSSVSREIPRNRKDTLHTRLTSNTRPQGIPAAPDNCPRWRTVEKSPAVETGHSRSRTRRDEGVPPYRRLRRESYPLSFRALVEKSPTAENENNRTRLPQNTCWRGLRALPAGAPCRALRRITAPLLFFQGAGKGLCGYRRPRAKSGCRRSG